MTWLLAKGCSTAADCQRAADEMPSDLLAALLIAATATALLALYVWERRRERRRQRQRRAPTRPVGQ